MMNNKVYRKGALFLDILANEFLPFEAKYIVLRNKKDYNLIYHLLEYFFNEIFPVYDESISQIEFLEHWNDFEIENVFDCYIEYLELLLNFDFKNKEVILSEYEFYKDKIQTKKDFLFFIKNLIKQIEEILNIENNLIKSEQLKITNDVIFKHINPDGLYKKDLILLNETLHKFIKYFKHLKKIAYKLNITENPNNFYNKSLINLEYLFFAVLNEFFNFLAHFAIGVTFFNSPKNFESNLNKARSHLKRAIMDILDIMILESGCITKDYLKIRVLKVASLGKTKKILNLIEELEKIYEKEQIYEKILKKLNKSLEKKKNEINYTYN